MKSTRPLVWGERVSIVNKLIRPKYDDSMEYVVVGFRLMYVNDRDKAVADPTRCLAIVVNELGPMPISFDSLFEEWELVVREGVDPLIGITTYVGGEDK